MFSHCGSCVRDVAWAIYLSGQFVSSKLTALIYRVNWRDVTYKTVNVPQLLPSLATRSSCSCRIRWSFFRSFQQSVDMAEHPTQFRINMPLCWVSDDCHSWTPATRELLKLVNISLVCHHTYNFISAPLLLPRMSKLIRATEDTSASSDTCH